MGNCHTAGYSQCGTQRSAGTGSKSEPPSKFQLAMRIASIDLFRVIAILGVIVIHVNPFTYQVFGGGAAHVVELVFSRAGRIGVPYFFIIAGYFFGQRVQQGEDPIGLFVRYGRRLGILFVVWSVFYLIVPCYPIKLFHEGYAAFEATKLDWCLKHPYLLLLQGTKPHLWFLPALISALAILSLCLRRSARVSFAMIAIALYVVGLLTGPYLHTPAGLDFNIDPRNGPFFSTLFVFIGWSLATTPFRLRTSTALAVMIAGGVGFALELSAIPWIFGKPPKIDDLGVLLIPYAVGFALLAINNPHVGAGTVWPRIGRYVLGIYAVHVVFVGWLWPLHALFHSYIWELAFPIVVLGLAFATKVVIGQHPRLRPLVR